MTGQELKGLREKYNLTQKDFAEAIQTTQAQISKWENGLHKISRAYQNLIRLSFEKYEK